MLISELFGSSLLRMAVLTCMLIASVASAQTSTLQGNVGVGPVTVHTKFGGQIFGFDVDQHGTEGILTEASFLDDGRILAAVETFDQATGKILRVIKQVTSKDDFITLGIAGTGLGLVEREHVRDIFVNRRTYSVLNPLSSPRFTGTWTPQLNKDDILMSVSRLQGTNTTLFLGFENGGENHTFLLPSDVAANTFGTRIALPDDPFFFSNSPQVAYDSLKNRAVVAASDAAVGGPPPMFALINLTTGKITEFPGIPGPFPFRQGSINGLAVDSADGIACTTTEVDFRVEFYDLQKRIGFAKELPGATGQLQSGTDVEFDPINKLFLVAQSVSSTGPGSSIQVYDPKGNLVESLDGFDFSNSGAVIFTHIAINPDTRTGYVDGPDVTQLQSFSY